MSNDPVKLIQQTLEALDDHADDRLAWLHEAILKRVRNGKPAGIKDGSIEDYLGTRAAGRGKNDAWRQCRFNLRDKAIREAAQMLIAENPLPDSAWPALELCAELLKRMKQPCSSNVHARLKDAMYYDPTAATLSIPRLYDIMIS